MVYVTSHLHFSGVLLGWLLTGYGVATMFSEGVLVRLIVPYLGEVNSMRLGLVSFAVQTVIIALASSKKWVFISIIFSMLSNLVYPSISSLVSRLVEEEVLGEALGALNGIKAITEGFGPLIFGCLMGLFEDSPLPGAPYLIATVISAWAFLHCYELPSEPEIVIAKYQAAVQKDESLKSLLYSDYEI
jgi:MFS transporter, DHA1 family, tetracycline resistance protein